MGANSDRETNRAMPNMLQKLCPVHLRCWTLVGTSAQKGKKESLEWGLNPRPFAYEANALPLSYRGDGWFFCD